MIDCLLRKYVLEGSLPFSFTKFFDRRKRFFKKSLFFLSLTIFFFGFINKAYSEVRGKLLYFYSDTCAYCKAWENEIADIYVKTEFENEYKLSFIEFSRNVDPKKYGISLIVKGTPTFIFMKDQKEVGRIEGYNGKELFWWQVDEIVEGNRQK